MRTSETWDWASLESLSAGPDRIQAQLGQLLDGTEEARSSARSYLYCELANQGQLYSAAAPCVDVIVEHARQTRSLSSESVSLLEAILNARTPGLVVHPSGETVDAAEYCRGRILDVLPQMLDAATGADVAYFREVCFLIPQLADSSSAVIEFLRLAEERHQGELQRFCREAIEEAEEVMRDGHMA